MIGTAHFQFAGCLLILLALSHAWFPRLLAWREDTATLSLLNRQVLYVHSFFIALVVFLNGLLFIAWPHLLVQPSPLRNVLLIGIALFWFFRLVFQLFVYDRKLWQGNPANTVIHVSLAGVWMYLVLVSGGTLLLY